MYLKTALISTLLFSILTSLSFAQQVEKEDNNENDTAYNIFLHVDPRLNVLVSKSDIVEQKRPKIVRGFRIQIYNGNNRTEANSIRTNFIKQFPEYRSYLIYKSPTFRVRVGDFRTRSEAEIFSQKISFYFKSRMIVPEVINVK